MNNAIISISYFQNGANVNPYDLLSVNYPLNYTGFVYSNNDITQRVINGTIFINDQEIPFVGTTFSGSINITKVENNINVVFKSGIYDTSDINDLFYGDVITYNANITTAQNSYTYNENFIVNVNLNVNLKGSGQIELLLMDNLSTQKVLKALPLEGDDYMFNINNGDINVGNYALSVRIIKDGYSELPVGLLDITINKYENLDFNISSRLEYPNNTQNNENNIISFRNLNFNITPDIAYPKYLETFYISITSGGFNNGTITITNTDTNEFKIYSSVVSPFVINSEDLYDDVGLVKGLNQFSITYDDINQTGTKLFTLFINKNKPTITISNNQPEYYFGDTLDLSSTALFNGNPISGSFEYYKINNEGEHILLNLANIYDSDIYKIYSKFISADSFYNNNVSDIIEVQIQKKTIIPTISILGDNITIQFPQDVSGTIILHFTTSNPLEKYNYSHEISINNDSSYVLDINNIITNLYKFNYSIKAQFFGINYNNTFSNLITYSKSTKNDISITNLSISSNNDFSKPIIFTAQLPDVNIYYGDLIFSLKDQDNETIIDLYADINGGIATLSYYTLKVGNYAIEARSLENQLYYESPILREEFSVDAIKLNILPLTKIQHENYVELLCGVDKSNINVGSLIFYNHYLKIGLGSYNVRGGSQATYITNNQYSENAVRCYYYGLPNFINSNQSNYI